MSPMSSGIGMANAATKLVNAATQLANAATKLANAATKLANAATKLANAATALANAATELANAVTELVNAASEPVNAASELVNAATELASLVTAFVVWWLSSAFWAMTRDSAMSLCRPGVQRPAPHFHIVERVVPLLSGSSRISLSWEHLQTSGEIKKNLDFVVQAAGSGGPPWKCLYVKANRVAEH